MRVKVNDGQDARFGLESEHPLVTSLILPGTRLNQSYSLVRPAVVPMDMTCDENVRYGVNHHVIFKFR